jgi:DNA-directed RNA polymerase specialized sigma24 family protein
VSENLAPDDDREAEAAVRFSTTRWTVVLASRQPADNTAALETLCRIYWRPVFAFVRRRGYSVADAQDLTQDFFLSLFSGDFLSRADRSRGRFRSLLQIALGRFLADARDRAKTQKRGGRFSFISWDNYQAETSGEWLTNLSAAWTPEKAFDVRWAQALLAQVFAQLRAAHARPERRRKTFETLQSFLTASADQPPDSYEQAASQLGMSPTAVKTAVFRLRQQYRTLLRKEVARTVESSSDIDDELRYLGSLLRDSPAAAQ